MNWKGGGGIPGHASGGLPGQFYKMGLAIRIMNIYGLGVGI